jgi:hypothetical protein
MEHNHTFEIPDDDFLEHQTPPHRVISKETLDYIWEVFHHNYQGDENTNQPSLHEAAEKIALSEDDFLSNQEPPVRNISQETIDFLFKILPNYTPNDKITQLLMRDDLWKKK